MGVSVVAAVEKANAGAATSCSKRGNKLPRPLPLAATARRLWPRKTAEEIAFRTGVSVRTARYWLSGAHAMPAATLVALIASDQGAAFLEVVVQAMPARAFAAFQRRLREEVRAELIADLARQRFEIDRL